MNVLEISGFISRNLDHEGLEQNWMTSFSTTLLILYGVEISLKLLLVHLSVSLISTKMLNFNPKIILVNVDNTQHGNRDEEFRKTVLDRLVSDSFGWMAKQEDV